jgi:hypothetical protein
MAAGEPDLSITFVEGGPDKIKAAKVFQLEYDAHNSAAAAAGATTSAVYLSKNTTRGASDILLHQDEVEALAPGQDSSESTPVVVPATTPGGRYFIVVCANSVKPRIKESTRANNCAASPFTTKVGVAVAGRFSGHTDFDFGHGCDFVHQTLEGEFTAFAPYEAGTFTMDGCVDGTPDSFAYTGTFTLEAGLTTLTGTVTGPFPGDDGFELTLNIHASPDSILMTGVWDNSGEIPARGDPLNGVMVPVDAG